VPLLGIPVAIGYINRSSPSWPVSIPHLKQSHGGVTNGCLVAKVGDDLVTNFLALYGQETAASFFIPGFTLSLVFEVGKVSVALELLLYHLLSDAVGYT